MTRSSARVRGDAGLQAAGPGWSKRHLGLSSVVNITARAAGSAEQEEGPRRTDELDWVRPYSNGYSGAEVTFLASYERVFASYERAQGLQGCTDRGSACKPTRKGERRATVAPDQSGARACGPQER